MPSPRNKLSFFPLHLGNEHLGGIYKGPDVVLGVKIEDE